MTMDLTDEQRLAVEAGPRCCIIACAGSGKSTTLTHRIKHRIEQGANPNNIVAITFTRKAANELKLKLDSIGVSIQFIGTVHSWALRELNKIAKDGVMLRAAPASYFESEIRHEIGISGKKISFESVAEDRCKDPLGSLILNRVRLRMADSGLIDFNGILLKMLEAVKMQEIELPELFVDEFQDTGPIEGEIYRHAPGPMTIVGDKNQCLYAFRGADPESIDRMSVGMEIVRLTRNFRCSPSIDRYAFEAMEGSAYPMDAGVGGIVGAISRLAKEKPITVLCGFNKTVGIVSQTLRNSGVEVDSGRDNRDSEILEAYLRYSEAGTTELLGHALGLLDPNLLSSLKQRATRNLGSINEEFEADVARGSNPFAKHESIIRSLQEDFPHLGLLDLAEMVSVRPESDAQVQLMTVHASKGLEWDTVGFVDDIGKGDHQSRMRYVACTRARNELIHWRLNEHC